VNRPRRVDAPRQQPYLNAMLAAMKGEKVKALSFPEDPEVYVLLGMKDDTLRSLKNIIQENPINNSYS